MFTTISFTIEHETDTDVAEFISAVEMTEEVPPAMWTVTASCVRYNVPDSR